jgi:pimeloyl-ACP methyl ester carboxylesterase
MLVSKRNLLSRSVVLSSGVRLDYAEEGEPAGLPVVLLHGTTDSWKSFTGVLSHLPESLRVFALSVRGQGDSGQPPAGYRVPDLAADLDAFLDAVGVPAAIIAGHSGGSLIAQRFAIDRPARTRGLVLLGSTPAMSTNPVIRELWDTAVATLTDPVDPAFVLEFQASTVARPTADGLIEAAVLESLKVPASVWRQLFAGLLETDHTAELGRITAPTLVAWGTKDAFFTRHEQDALLRGIRGSRLIAYEGGGHAFHWEDPARFAADLTAFCEHAGSRFR